MRRITIVCAIALAAATSTTALAAAATATVIKPPPGYGWVGRLIKHDFKKPLGKDDYHIAMCVADRESHFDPKAYNPNSGASGVFQFVPSTWAKLSVDAGYGGKSPFNAKANVGTAAWAVAQPNIGWQPWGGHCP